jgi:hypothetical protein
MKDIDPAALEKMRDAAKADLVAASLGEAVKLCIDAAGAKRILEDGIAATTAA